MPGATILQEDTSSAHLYTVLLGWAFRYKMLPDGRRQIVNFALPGDFIGLQASVFDKMSHSVEALTDVLLCVFPRDKLWELYEHYPSLSFDVTWLASREENILDQNLLSVGRRNALEKTAYLLLHLYVRALDVGLATPNRFSPPITQQHVADTLGMSLVHTNKTLKRLSDKKLIRWKNRQLDILNVAALAGAGGMGGRRRPLPPAHLTGAVLLAAGARRVAGVRTFLPFAARPRDFFCPACLSFRAWARSSVASAGGVP